MRTLSKILIGLLVVVVLGISSLAVALSHSSACGTAPALAPSQPGSATSLRSAPLARPRVRDQHPIQPDAEASAR